jgi:Sec-independent protein secretion pathway component TatC
VATQIMMALPIIILYEISIFLSKGVYRKRKEDSNPDEQQE